MFAQAAAGSEIKISNTQRLGEITFGLKTGTFCFLGSPKKTVIHYTVYSIQFNVQPSVYIPPPKSLVVAGPDGTAVTVLLSIHRFDAINLSVVKIKQLWKMAMEIVSFPIHSMVIFQFVMLVITSE